MTNLKDKVQKALENVVDTCTHMNIVDMGIVENVTIDETAKTITIAMVPTTPFCMFLDSIESEIELLVKNYTDFNDYTLVFEKSETAWTQERLSETAVAQLL
jgi:metal-sulfur cluster biosynthetic enzyme